VRYGGRFFTPTITSQRTSLLVEANQIEIKNSIIEHSLVNGVSLINSGAEFKNNIIRFNNNDAIAVGVLVESGSPVISFNKFENNTIGLRTIDASDSIINSNEFIDNTTKAMEIFGLIPKINLNYGSGNGIEGILISSNLLSAGSATLEKNDLPYILNDTVSLGGGFVLSFEPGVVIKGDKSGRSRFTVRDGGKILYNGSSADDVVFTSFYDDTIGGDVDNSPDLTPKFGDWYGIEILSGGFVDISGFTLRYAGMWGGIGEDLGGIRIKGGEAIIRNALIENNYQYGIRIIDDGILDMIDSTIKDHVEQKNSNAVGIKINSSIVSLENIIFSNNKFDIGIAGSSTISCVNCGEYTTEEP